MSEKNNLSYLGIEQTGIQHWNLSPEQLVQHSIEKKQGRLTASGALAIETGKFTGRSPKDRFLVKDALTESTVDWNEINIAFDSEQFDRLYEKVINYWKGKELYVRNCVACADETYALPLRVITEYPWQNQFAYNMFLRPDKSETDQFSPDWHVISAPGFKADPKIDGTRQSNFAIVNFTRKIVLIGGTGYTGEIKKGIFSVLNYILPHQKDVLSMHCSANMGANGDTALFFGLSGTGKTTLSADPNRRLIGDDEHGWTDKGLFNFEGGCYAKVIDLSSEKEPEIFAAIKSGAILENVIIDEQSGDVDFTATDITQNTRVSYPIHHIENAIETSVGGIPKNVFFLTFDAFGVLPPISRLTKEQAMYHFISGYTSKVAGTEEGVVEPQTTFSACFGAPFLPLHPTKYAEMLGARIEQYDTRVWLINTGMTGGSYGVGSRMSLKHTRKLITEALNGNLDQVSFNSDPIFGVEIPDSCTGVPSEILTPRNTWSNPTEYDKKAQQLAKAFVDNFRQFYAEAKQGIRSAAPKVAIEA